MPIDFACPSCSRQYRVKDELAGKNAKCGKCGHRMPIPQLVASASAISKGAASSKSAAAKAPAAKASSAKSIPTKAVHAKPVQKSKGGAGADSWLNEELEGSQSTVVKAPVGPRTLCPACGQPLAAGAVLCVTCGYDTRTKKKLETKHVGDEVKDVAKKARKREQLGYAGSLLRGTVFSFIGAVLGAMLWAGLAYLTMKEFVFAAWALGGLSGLGMALGHDEDDGTFAGIIAAFMALFGIVAAKVLIVVIFLAAFIGGVMGEIADEAGDPLVWKRAIVAGAAAEDKLVAQGLDPDEATEEQWDKAVADAEAEIANLDEKALDARIEALDAAEAEDDGEELVEADADPVPPEEERVEDQPGGVDQAAGVDEEALAAADAEAPPNFVSLFFESMFSPFDSIFILLAFFTAYKVGSGEMTD